MSSFAIIRCNHRSRYTRFGKEYLRLFPGVSSSNSGGKKYDNCVMKLSDPKKRAPDECADWKAVDGGQWYARGTQPYLIAKYDPSGDYCDNTLLHTTSFLNGVIYRSVESGTCISCSNAGCASSELDKYCAKHEQELTESATLTAALRGYKDTITDAFVRNYVKQSSKCNPACPGQSFSARTAPVFASLAWPFSLPFFFLGGEGVLVAVASD